MLSSSQLSPLQVFLNRIQGFDAITLVDLLQAPKDFCFSSLKTYYLRHNGSQEVFITAGKDLSKRKRSVQRVIEASKDQNGQKVCIVDEVGNEITRFQFKITPQNLQFQLKGLKDLVAKCWRQVAILPLPKRLGSLNNFDFLKEQCEIILDQDLLNFYFAYLAETDRMEIVRSLHTAFLCLLAIQSKSIDSILWSEATSIAALRDFHTLTSQFDESHKSYINDIAPTSKSLLIAFLLKGQPGVNELEMTEIEELRYLWSSFRLAVTIDDLCMNQLSGWVQKDLLPKGRIVDVEELLSILVHLSNDKNLGIHTGQAFDTKMVNQITKDLDYEWILERARLIDDEILSQCDFVVCLQNRISAICLHPNFSSLIPKGSKFCQGQGDEVRAKISNSSENLSVSKCVHACKLLNEINSRY